MERIGNELTLSAEGKTIRRHITQVKKLPEKEQNEPGEEQNDLNEAGQDVTTTEEHRRTKEADIAESDRQKQQPTAPAKKDPKLPPLKLGKKEGMWRLTKEGASTGDKGARAD
ncbi:unnamed protein product [Lasius platythorax]|uniref:Uncharacterized protein n=1 Tax=Lasius platythorax TaxID=488582 RepID=A0AAV2MX41_9HYME